MPQIIEITCPSTRTEAVVETLEQLDGVIGVTLQRDISIQPPGDVVTVKTTNSTARDVLAAVRRLIIDNDTFSIATTEPEHLISLPHSDLIDRETNEVTWETVASEFRKESTVEFNFLLLMALAGLIACAGLWTDRVQIVIGAMVIAPGFEPLLRMPFGVLIGPKTMFKRGLAATVLGYVALAVAAAIGIWILQAVDSSRSADLLSRDWVRYWSRLSPSGVFVAITAGAAGAVVVTAGRFILTAGVMIALALVPTAAVTGMAVAVGDVSLVMNAVGRWAVEAVAVMIAGAAVFTLKQRLIHKRRAMG